MGADRTLRDLLRPHLDAYYGHCFERLCHEALSWLYRQEGIAAAFEVGEYWSKATKIDVVGLRDDNWTDLGEHNGASSAPPRRSRGISKRRSATSRTPAEPRSEGRSSPGTPAGGGGGRGWRSCTPDVREESSQSCSRRPASPLSGKQIDSNSYCDTELSRSQERLRCTPNFSNKVLVAKP